MTLSLLASSVLLERAGLLRMAIAAPHAASRGSGVQPDAGEVDAEFESRPARSPDQ